MSYPMYLVEYIGAPRNHQTIFVETEKEGTGTEFQVIGDIQNGMEYESESGMRPETEESFSAKTYLGEIAATNMSRIGEICKSIPAPDKQFHGPRRLYPDVPLRRCQEWIQEVIQALTAGGVLQTRIDAGPSASREYWTPSEEHEEAHARQRQRNS